MTCDIFSAKVMIFKTPMKTPLHISSPTGIKKLVLRDHESCEIVLEDFEPGSRSFTLEVEMRGAGARCSIRGRIHVTGKDRKSWKIVQRFSGKSQEGTIDLRGIAEDASSLEFDGSAILDSGAKEVEVNVQEKIWLFDHAQGKALPILTVKTDRVKSARHAASITSVDEGQLFFLESRGIPRGAAETILKQGFLNNYEL